MDVERTRTRKTRFICTQRCVKKSSATRRHKDSPVENDSVQKVVVWMQLIVVKIIRLGFRSWTICHVCVLEHCCTQLRNSELQQTITKSCDSFPRRRQFKVSCGKGMGRRRIQTADFRTSCFLFTVQSVRLSASCIQSEQNVCNLNVLA